MITGLPRTTSSPGGTELWLCTRTVLKAQSASQPGDSAGRGILLRAEVQGTQSRCTAWVPGPREDRPEPHSIKSRAGWGRRGGIEL